MNANRTFGVEMELASKVTCTEMARQLTEAFQLAGINHVAHSAGYGHDTDGANRTVWMCKPDASIGRYGMPNGYPHGVEVVSPVLKGESGMAALKLVCGYITNRRLAKVTRGCGLHVHHGVRQEEVLPVIKAWKKIEDTVYEAMPASRKDNYYCKKLTGFSVDDVNSYQHLRARWLDRDMTRYRGFNLESFWMRGTIEFRCAAGTHEYLKIRNWVLITQMVIDRAVAGATFQAGVDNLVATLGGNVVALNSSGNRTQFGHKLNSMSATIDELVLRGCTREVAVTILMDRHGRSFRHAHTKFASHVGHLRKKGFNIFCDDDGVFKFVGQQAEQGQAEEHPALVWFRQRHQQFRLAA